MPKINGIAWDEDSKYYKELNRWNLSKRDGGMNRDGFEKYPQMLYMAQRHPLSNVYEVAAKEDVPSLDGKTVLFHAEQFNRSCQMIVNDEREYDRAYQAGWRPSQAEAMQYREGHAQMVAEAAAFRAHEDRKMSEKAQAEVAAVEASTPEHVAEIPASPVRRGRKPGSKNKPKPEAQV
jgi:hypothetical protein